MSAPDSRLLLRPLTGLLRRRTGKVSIVALFVVIGAVAAGCANGTYPLDIFYEMHYQQSYQSHEPPRLSVPKDAVPVTGRSVALTPHNQAEVENPYPGQGIDDGEGARLFATNCSMCHGDSAQGDGPVLNTMKANYNYEPRVEPNLALIGSSLSEVFTFIMISNRDLILGEDLDPPAVMPKFEKLLTERERWILVNYVRNLQNQ